MKTTEYGPVVSITAGEALTKKRFVDFAGKHTVDLPAIGVTIDDCDSGDEASVQITGIAVVEAGGQITAGNWVSSDADGKAVALTIVYDNSTNLAASLNKKCGIALDDASGAGVFIRVMLIK